MKQRLLQIVIVCVFGAAMTVVAVAGILVAEVEPGATKVAAAAVAAVALVLAVVGLIPASKPADVSINVVRRLLRTISTGVVTTVIGCVFLSAGALAAWRFGPSAIISEPVACSGASAVQYPNWTSNLRELSCDKAAQVALNSWQPSGRVKFFARIQCIQSEGPALTPTDLGISKGFACPKRQVAELPLKITPPPSLPLEIEDASVTKNGELDITFRNRNELPAYIERVRATVVGTQAASPLPILKQSASFRLIFADAAVGAQATAELHLVVPKNEIDRIVIQLKLPAAATVKFDFEYNKSQSISVTRTFNL